MCGTIHVANKDLYPLDKTFSHAIQDSDLLAVELDVSAIDASRLLDDVAERAQLPEGQSLFELLPSSLYFDLDAALYRYRIHLVDKDDRAPWFFLWILQGLSLVDSVHSAEHGLDLHFIEEARRLGMPLHALETIDLQLEAFSSFSLPIQIELLQQALETSSSSDETLQKLIDLWENGDAGGLERFFTEGSGAPPSAPAAEAFTRNLLDERNLKMADQLEQRLLDGQKVFVAVGALHLTAGEHGLVDIFARRGYSLRQMESYGKEP